MIFHLTTKAEWNKAQSLGYYEAAGFSDEGFIHLSSFGQILSVANSFYKNVTEPVLLAIDNSTAGAALKWEGENSLEFPHLYRRIEVAEVHAVIPLLKNSEGIYVGSKELDELAQAREMQSTRLRLREFQLSDYKMVHSYASDADLVKFMPWGPNTENETRAFLTRNFKYQSDIPRKNFDMAITDASTGEYLGSAGLMVRSYESGVGFIGYILKREAHGKGYATEASEALLKFGFETLGLHRIEATCDEKNAASFKVMQRIGMHKEGLLRDNMMVKGSRRSTYICAILKTQFDQLNK